MCPDKTNTSKFDCRNMLDLDNEPRKVKRKPYHYNKACWICGGAAVDHLHYGAISCFCCRQFFRRAVEKNYFRQYKCKGTPKGTCTINVGTRKACQRCRFDKCTQVGMKISALQWGEKPTNGTGLMEEDRVALVLSGSKGGSSPCRGGDLLVEPKSPQNYSKYTGFITDEGHDDEEDEPTSSVMTTQTNELLQDVQEMIMEDPWQTPFYGDCHPIPLASLEGYPTAFHPEIYSGNGWPIFYGEEPALVPYGGFVERNAHSFYDAFGGGYQPMIM